LQTFLKTLTDPKGLYNYLKPWNEDIEKIYKTIKQNKNNPEFRQLIADYSKIKNPYDFSSYDKPLFEKRLESINLEFKHLGQYKKN